MAAPLKPRDSVLTKPIATWLCTSDYERFAALASKHGVTQAAYLRSIVVDALADEARADLEKEMNSLSQVNKAYCTGG